MSPSQSHRCLGLRQNWIQVPALPFNGYVNLDTNISELWVSVLLLTRLLGRFVKTVAIPITSDSIRH